MQSTRARILEYLESNHAISAVALSRALSMTAANARHHLAVLEEQGLVEVAGQKENGGRGRPTLQYMLSKKRQKHNLDHLAGALFAQTVGKREGKGREKRLKALATRMTADAQEPNGSITHRLVTSVSHLNERNYQSHWEARAEGPRIILGQCPYAAIIDEHPELCCMDKYILENLLDAPVEQTAKIAHRPEGPNACVFVVKREAVRESD
jgi:predicted ArsR family transcriptional regulator